MLNLGVEPFAVAAVGAIAAEVVRLKVALNNLEVRTTRSKDSATLRFPKAYFLITPLYILCAAFSASLLPPGTNDFYYFYVGASFPKFIGTLVQAGDALIGRLTRNSEQPALDRSVDDTALDRSSTRPVYRVRNGVWRYANGLYAFTTA